MFDENKWYKLNGDTILVPGFSGGIALSTNERFLELNWEDQEELVQELNQTVMPATDESHEWWWINDVHGDDCELDFFLLAHGEYIETHPAHFAQESFDALMNAKVGFDFD